MTATQYAQNIIIHISVLGQSRLHHQQSHKSVQTRFALSAHLKSNPMRMLLSTLWRLFAVVSWANLGFTISTLANVFRTLPRLRKFAHRMTKDQGWSKPYIHTYICCMYGIFSREITIHTVHIRCRYTVLANPTKDAPAARCARNSSQQSPVS